MTAFSQDVASLPGETAGYYGSGAAPENEPAVQQYLRIALRWRWIIAGAILLFAMLGLIVTLLMTPMYSAVTTIEISRDSDQVTNFQGVERETTVADQEFYQTQYGLLRARTLAERVAIELRLVDDPAFYEMFGVDVDDPAFELENGRYSAGGRDMRQRVAGETLLDNVSIEPTRLSRLVDIRVSSPDPEFSARVANTWADNFIKTNLERKVEATSYGRDQLQRQLAEFKERLDESQRQLVAYASNQEIINLPAQVAGQGGANTNRSIVAENLVALNAALAKATADRIEAEARYRQVTSGKASGEALTNLAINGLRQKRAELGAKYEEMMVTFEPGYPSAVAMKSQIDELDKAIAREEARIERVLDVSYREARQRELALQEKVGELKDEFLDLRRRSIQYNIYEQEVETNQALYDGLLQRFKEIGVAGGVGVNNIAIVDPARVPEEPSSPNLILNLLASLIAGAALGAVIALALEQLDDAIADPAEVQRRLGLPLLGSVPKVDDQDPAETLLDRKSDLADAYITVQTSLSFATAHGVPRSFSVTSTRPSEGKSTSALSLAATLARTGRKVILVDGDMRSPSVHQLGGVPNTKGLSNYLSGEDDLPSLFFRMEEFNLTAMSAGPPPPNAAELLTGPRLDQMVETLLREFDHVVIDSPPIMGLADAPLIASHVEGIVYVVESHGIKSKIVRRAIDRLRGVKAQIFGAILTKFEAQKSRYGYGYDYGYSYGREKSEAEAS